MRCKPEGLNPNPYPYPTHPTQNLPPLPNLTYLVSGVAGGNVGLDEANLVVVAAADVVVVGWI